MHARQNPCANFSETALPRGDLDAGGEMRLIFASMIRFSTSLQTACCAFVLAIVAFSFPSESWGQYPGWQMAADYDMDIALDTANHSYEGEMKLVWTNNSPDALARAYFHLFFNAFQPGSMMDIRSQTIDDPDPRVGDRIGNLPESEWGKQEIRSITVNGKPATFEVDGTILVVNLPFVVKSGKKATFEMKWSAQVPRQIRRSGWMNSEGIEYSMTQWFPKLCEYDHDGWHTDPYVGREFHGIWGDFEVEIEVPAGYVVGGSGAFEKIGGTAGKDVWKSEADNVIDFAWAADPEYVQFDTLVDGKMLRFYHQADTAYEDAWAKLPRFTARAMAFFEDLIGSYPYPQYSVIQGGDGGMEYPMATLITGNRSLRSLVGVTVHEMAHSWFQALIATNESLYEYLDEGFTSYATSLCMAHLFEGGMEPHYYAYGGYIMQATSGNEEPLSTHADHYSTNRGYGIAAYSKGEVLLAQLGGIIGPEARDQGIRNYFKAWSFKHPGINDFKRIMEMTSGIELDWYFQYFVNSTHVIDYAIESVQSTGDSVKIDLQRIGGMPCPIDLRIEMESGESVNYHIPLVMMRGHRPLLEGETLAADWAWTHPTYSLELPLSGRIQSIELDPNKWLADVDRGNNRVEWCNGCLQEFKTH